MDGLDAGHETGHRRGAGADMERLAGGAEIGENLGKFDGPRIAPHPWRIAEEIEQLSAASVLAAIMGNQEAAATGRGEHRFANAGRPQTGNDAFAHLFRYYLAMADTRTSYVG